MDVLMKGMGHFGKSILAQKFGVSRWWVAPMATANGSSGHVRKPPQVPYMCATLIIERMFQQIIELSSVHCISVSRQL